MRNKCKDELDSDWKIRTVSLDGINITAKILKATKNVAWHIRLDLTEATKEGEDG